MVDKDVFERWISASGAVHPSVDFGDVGKVAEITEVDMSDTKYGTRLRVTLKFSDGEEKVAFLSKSKTRTLLEYFKQIDPSLVDVNNWIGRKVKIERVNVMVAGQMKETLILLPADQ